MKTEDSFISNDFLCALKEQVYFFAIQKTGLSRPWVGNPADTPGGRNR